MLRSPAKAQDCTPGASHYQQTSNFLYREGDSGRPDKEIAGAYKISIQLTPAVVVSPSLNRSNPLSMKNSPWQWISGVVYKVQNHV
jgi:hypothetical protein